MVMTEKFLEWFENATDDDRYSSINMALLVLGEQPFKKRIKRAFGILMGKKHIKWICNSQKGNG